MAKIGSEKHERILQLKARILKEEGYKVIILDGKSPDAIAVKGNKIIAIEIVGRKHKVGRGWAKSRTMKSIRENYYMFDSIEIVAFYPKGVEWLPPYTPISYGK